MSSKVYTGKRIACRVAAMLCQEDMDAGLVKARYEGLKEIGGPSYGVIEDQMRVLIKELRHRGRLGV